MKKIIKIIVFLLLLCIIWNYIFKILWLNKNSVSYFYEEPKNSLDVVYCGSSNAYAYFNSTLAYDLYGYTTYLLSTDAQPFELTKYLIKESQKYQNPKLYIIDITKVTSNKETITEPWIRKTVDSMKFSKNRIDAINETLSYRNVDKRQYLNYYFSFFLYHNRWKNIDSSNLGKEEKIFYKGYLLGPDQVKVQSQKEDVWNDNISELPENNDNILLNLIDYIKFNNLNVLFVIPKRLFSEIEKTRLNKAVSIIEKNELKVINFNKIDELNNINFKTDFYNFAHLNVYGATKYTLYFSKYLKENYDLPNHKGDSLYNSWDSEYKRFKEDFKKLTNKDFNKVLKEYKKQSK